MKKNIAFVLGFLIASGIAFAATLDQEFVGTNKFRDNTSRTQVFNNGIMIGSVRRVMDAGSNAITGTYSSSFDYDFPDAGWTEIKEVRVSLPGAQVGDICLNNMGTVRLSDGGTASLPETAIPAHNVLFSCYVSTADSVDFVMYPIAQIDLPDASFTVRVVSNLSQ